jgi:hypothetical protein
MVRRPLAYEKDRVAYKKHVSLTKHFRDRETETWIKYKDGRFLPRVIESHMFSEYKWSLPTHRLDRFVRMKSKRVVNPKYYKGKKRYNRAIKEFMKKALHLMTDYMFDDMIYNRNKLKVLARNKSRTYIDTGVLGVYTYGNRPRIDFKWRYNRLKRGYLTPSINFSNATIDKIKIEHYKGNGYANVHLQRSLTKNQ